MLSVPECIDSRDRW